MRIHHGLVALSLVVVGCALPAQEDERGSSSTESALVCGATIASAAGTYTWSGVRGGFDVTATLVLNAPPKTCFGCMPIAPTFDLTEQLDPTCLQSGCRIASQLRHTAGQWSITSNGRSESVTLNPDTTLADYTALNPVTFDEQKCHPFTLITKEDDGSGVAVTEIFKRSH